MEQSTRVNPLNNPDQPPPDRVSCVSPALYGLLVLIIIFTLMIRLAYEILASGINPDSAGSIAVGPPLAEGLIILGFSLPFAIFWKDRYYRSIFQVFTLAAVFVLFSIPARLAPPTTLQAEAVLQICLTIGFIGFSWLLKKFFLQSPGQKPFTVSLPWIDWRSIFSLLTVGLIAIPWLAWGAMGSPLDTLLQKLSSLAFGFAAAFIIEVYFIKPGLLGSHFRAGFFLRGGMVIALTLWVMASGLGYHFGVMQVLIMACLTPLSWVWSGLRTMPQDGLDRDISWANLLFPTLLIGLATALPTIFIDANELALIISLSSGEILQWGLKASLVTIIVGILTIIIVLFIRRRAGFHSADRTVTPSRRKSWSGILIAATIVVWIIGIAIYFLYGQPGFYGEKMFVILNKRADLSAEAKLEGYMQRRQAVYAELTKNADSSQANLRQFFERWNIPYTPYYLVNGIEVPKNTLLRFWLSKQPEVDRILDSPHLRPLAEPLPVETGIQINIQEQEPAWNLTIIGADRVWQDFGITGQGVLVGQSDSGVQWDHPELRDSYRGKDGSNQYNWLDPWTGSTSPTDHGGHGTHTLGTIVGKNTGVAPGAEWIGCVNLERNLGNPPYYLNCLQFMLAPYPQDGDPLRDGRPDLGAMVLNNSWGCPNMEGCDAEALKDAVDALKVAGVFVVASAGNDGPVCSSLSDPIAIYHDVFSVGAIDAAGKLAPFSSVGPVTVDGSGRIKPDIVAPGVQILSAFPGNTYQRLEGTSMAGPHVVGVVALMWSANPKLIGNIERTVEILQESAAPYQGDLPSCPEADQIPSSAFGYGIVDAYQAVKLSLQEP